MPFSTNKKTSKKYIHQFPSRTLDQRKPKSIYRKDRANGRKLTITQPQFGSFGAFGRVL